MEECTVHDYSAPAAVLHWNPGVAKVEHHCPAHAPGAQSFPMVVVDWLHLLIARCQMYVVEVVVADIDGCCTSWDNDTYAHQAKVEVAVHDWAVLHLAMEEPSCMSKRL